MECLPLGISLCSYQPRDVHDFVEEGFRYFEISLPGKLAQRGEEERFVEVAQQYVTQMAREQVQPFSFHLPFAPHWDISVADAAAWRETVACLKNLITKLAPHGYQVYVVHGCGMEPIVPEERALRVSHAKAALQELCGHAADLGARVALENLPRSCVGNASGELHAMTDGVLPVCFDVNHLLCETHDEFLDCLQGQIITTHLSDYDGLDEKHWLPGRGVIAWRHVVDRLMASGYQGPYLFELGMHDGIPYTPAEVKGAFLKLMDREEQA